MIAVAKRYGKVALGVETIASEQEQRDFWLEMAKGLMTYAIYYANGVERIQNSVLYQQLKKAIEEQDCESIENILVTIQLFGILDETEGMVSKVKIINSFSGIKFNITILDKEGSMEAQTLLYHMKGMYSRFGNKYLESKSIQ